MTDIPGTILYIDDRLTNRVIVRRAVESLTDATIMAMANGDDGIHAAKVYQPSAILLDLNLKDEDGESVLKRLKNDSDTADIPVFVLSVDESEERWRTMRQLGASGRILWSADLSRLVDNIMSVVAAANS